MFYESAKEELLIERAEGQYLIDEKGNKFLDLSNNVAHVGHCHPATGLWNLWLIANDSLVMTHNHSIKVFKPLIAVTNAVTKQMGLQYTNTRYLNPVVVNVNFTLSSIFWRIQYSEDLLSHFDKSLDTVLFCNSGSEATDLALRLAKYFTEREE